MVENSALLWSGAPVPRGKLVSVVMLTSCLPSDARSLAALTRYVCLFFSLSLVYNHSHKKQEHLHYYKHHLLTTTRTNKQRISTATTITSNTTIISITSLQPVALTSKGYNTRCLPTLLHILSLPTSSTPMFIWLCPIKKRIMIPNAFPLPYMSIPYPLLLSFLRISSRVWPSPSGYVPFLSFKTAKSIVLAVLVDMLIIGRCDIRFTTYITGCTPPIFS